MVKRPSWKICFIKSVGYAYVGVICADAGVRTAVVEYFMSDIQTGQVS